MRYPAVRKCSCLYTMYYTTIYNNNNNNNYDNVYGAVIMT